MSSSSVPNLYPPITPLVEVNSDAPSGPLKVTTVANVDWSDPTFVRAGIVPVYIDFQKGLLFVGLGIAKYGSNLTILGGVYEKTDYDLLATGIREYKEEMGPNLTPIESMYLESDDYLLHRFVIVSSIALTIVLPVRSMIRNFTPTDELDDMLWITPNQLTIMLQRADINFAGSSTKYFSFSRGLTLEFAQTLARLLYGEVTREKVASGITPALLSIPQRSPPKLRTERATVRPIPTMIPIDERDFVRQISPSKEWISCFVSVTETLVGVTSSSAITYLIPNKRPTTLCAILAALVAVGCYVWTATSVPDPSCVYNEYRRVSWYDFNRQYSRLVRALGPSIRSTKSTSSPLVLNDQSIAYLKSSPFKVTSIEHYGLSPDLIDYIYNDFVDSTKMIESIADDAEWIVRHNQIISEYEATIYFLKESTGKVGSVVRTCFLEFFHHANQYIYSVYPRGATYYEVEKYVVPKFVDRCEKPGLPITMKSLVAFQVVDVVSSQYLLVR